MKPVTYAPPKLPRCSLRSTSPPLGRHLGAERPSPKPPTAAPVRLSVQTRGGRVRGGAPPSCADRCPVTDRGGAHPDATSAACARVRGLDPRHPRPPAQVVALAVLR